jgi:DNA-binding LacI/PurR family transcriptional regulator
MVKLKDIAKKTGHTVSTVSRALRGDYDLNGNTVKKIRGAAEELGYSGGIFRNRSSLKTIGVVLPEVRSSYYAELVHTLDNEIRKSGYRMLFAISGFEVQGIREMFDYFNAMEVGGIIVNEPVSSDAEFVRHIAESGTPAVLFSESTSRKPLDTVYVDPQICMELAVNHLYDLGHREFGYIGEPNSHSRYESLVRVLNDKGLVMKNGHVKVGPERFEQGGYLRMKDLLAGESMPTALIASYDQVAIGSIKAAREAGLVIPRDLSIIGVDNIVMNDYLDVGLDSITNPVEQIGVIAVRILVGNINNHEEHVVQNVALRSKLVIRSSTAVPRGREK